MGANPHANGGLLLRDLVMPDFRDYAVEVPKPGTVDAEATRVMGRFLRDVMKLNAEMPATSASLARTRRPPIAWATLFEVTQSRFHGGNSCPPTTTSLPTAA